MIKVLRITLSSNNPYDNVEILDRSEQDTLGIHNIFEDAQVVFKCKTGTFMLPDYKIRMIQLKKYAPKPLGRKFKRILLDDELNFSDIYQITSDQYDKYGIPQVFRSDEQFVFWCKSDGIIIVPDFQIIYIRV